MGKDCSGQVQMEIVSKYQTQPSKSPNHISMVKVRTCTSMDTLVKLFQICNNLAADQLKKFEFKQADTM